MSWYVARQRRGRLFHHVLMVRANGTGGRGLYLPRVGTCVVAAALGVALTALGLATADYLTLKREASTVASTRQQVDVQRALIETFQKRIGDVRKEIASWGELHARMAEPFGPDAGAARPTVQTAGIGGGTGSVQPDPEGEQPVIWQEVEALAASVLAEGPRVRALERTVSSAGRAIAAMPSRWPVRGAVNSEFGRRKSPWGEAIEHHNGLDIAASLGTPVKAPATATVVFTGSGGEYGLAVVLDHGNDVKSLYGHLSKIQVTVGQRVERGFVVALTGNTGRSSGPHLHYEVKVKNQTVNPRAFLWNAPDRS